MKISILIPCYNGEKVIEKCVDSCLKQTRPADEVVVVNDGSTDKTMEILKRFDTKIILVNILQNSGNKSRAQEKGLKHVTGDVFIAVDSDTYIDKGFVLRVERAFRNPEVSAFSGYVKSTQHNWITACREIDYVVSQQIHKTAQSFINALFVIPGTAAAYRTKIFKVFCGFDHDTLTEDLDFTYKLHRNNMKIKYDKKAIVYTQDPGTIHSYVNQMRRWYAGGWQNLLKHIKIFRKPQHAFELSLVYFETLLFSVTTLFLPLVNLKFFLIFYIPFLITMLVMAIFTSVIDKRLDILIYLPTYIIIIYINSYVFLEQFVKEVILRRKNLVWYQPERRMLA